MAPALRRPAFAKSAMLSSCQSEPCSVSSNGRSSLRTKQLAKSIGIDKGIVHALSVPVHWGFRFLVAPPRSGELLICAKHLFVAAMMVWGLRWPCGRAVVEVTRRPGDEIRFQSPA